MVLKLERPLITSNQVEIQTSRIRFWCYIWYKAGKTNVNADALSRNPIDLENIEDYDMKAKNNFKLISWVWNFCHCLHYRRITSRVSDRIRCLQVSSWTISNSYIANKCKWIEILKNLKIFQWKKRRFRLFHRKIFKFFNMLKIILK